MADSLATVGKEICELLDELEWRDFGGVAGSEDAHYMSLILNEWEKFRIWLVDSSILGSMHISLDYRVHGAAGLKKAFSMFLGDLKETIEELIEFICPTLQEQPQPDIVDEYMNNDGTPTLAVYHSSMQDIINRLFHFSSKLPLIQVDLDGAQHNNSSELALARGSSLHGMTDKLHTFFETGTDCLPAVHDQEESRINKAKPLSTPSTSRSLLEEGENSINEVSLVNSTYSKTSSADGKMGLVAVSPTRSDVKRLYQHLSFALRESEKMLDDVWDADRIAEISTMRQIRVAVLTVASKYTIEMQSLVRELAGYSTGSACTSARAEEATRTLEIKLYGTLAVANQNIMEILRKYEPGAYTVEAAYGTALQEAWLRIYNGVISILCDHGVDTEIMKKRVRVFNGRFYIRPQKKEYSSDQSDRVVGTMKPI